LSKSPSLMEIAFLSNKDTYLTYSFYIIHAID
jgi:hypothetical protein